jgi:hypothetical protein
MGDHRHQVAALVQQRADRRHVLKGLPLTPEGQDGGDHAERQRDSAAHGHDGPEDDVVRRGEDRRQIDAVKRKEHRQQGAACPQRRQAGDEHRGGVGRRGAETGAEIERKQKSRRDGPHAKEKRQSWRRPSRWPSGWQSRGAAVAA